MAKIFRSFRMDELMAKQLSVEAAKRRKWPNKFMEQALEDWFTIEGIVDFEMIAKQRGLTRKEGLRTALMSWANGG